MAIVPRAAGIGGHDDRRLEVGHDEQHLPAIASGETQRMAAAGASRREHRAAWLIDEGACQGEADPVAAGYPAPISLARRPLRSRAIINKSSTVSRVRRGSGSGGASLPSTDRQSSANRGATYASSLIHIESIGFTRAQPGIQRGDLHDLDPLSRSARPRGHRHPCLTRKANEADRPGSRGSCLGGRRLRCRGRRPFAPVRISRR
jgi:hypothetical protein